MWINRCSYGRKNRCNTSNIDEEMAYSSGSMDDDMFEIQTGPKRFSYRELVRATSNFADEGELGQGGFGGVYRGVLSNMDVSVKRISKESKQGEKEYKSEVTTISQLRHRNLVRLIGWCHKREELLLVYEILPNQSLDKHLFRRGIALTWEVRYKIAIGLASALMYLHEEWEQCVVHRDIKSSNIMLDSSFNAKLGDFGLARLVDHDLGFQTTVLAGTSGYIAPECFDTGRSSKEADVYSFGVVALEIACGRKPLSAELSLVKWVWDYYGRGDLLDAADKKLKRELNELEMEQLMVLGLWCSSPEPKSRPSATQVINFLKSESPLPTPPLELPPPPVYRRAAANVPNYLSSSADLTETRSQGDRSLVQCCDN